MSGFPWRAPRCTVVAVDAHRQPITPEGFDQHRLDIRRPLFLAGMQNEVVARMIVEDGYQVISMLDMMRSSHQINQARGDIMSVISRTTPVLAAVFLLTACSTTVQVGNDFDVSSTSKKIERGMTTQSQIRSWLGSPTNTGVSVETDGRSFDEWTYYFAAGRLPNMSNPNMKLLQLKFDKQGVVQGYNWSASGQ